MHKDQPPCLGLSPRWLTPRRVALGALFLGTLALALVRVDVMPGSIVTAVMILVAWGPMMLPLRRRWVRWVWIGIAAPVVLFHLGWWMCDSVLRDLKPFGGWLRDGGQGLQVREIDPVVLGLRIEGSPVPLELVRFGVGLATAALFASLAAIRRSLRREEDAAGSDSAAQVAVVAGAWLVLAGAVADADAITRPGRVLWQFAGPAWQGCDPGMEERPPPPVPRPAICQDGPSEVDVGHSERWNRCLFCRDLTRPALQRAAGRFSLGVAVLGALIAVGAAARVRRRVRWLERVGQGQVNSVALVYYTPAWGSLEGMTRLVGGPEPQSLGLACLVVRTPPDEERATAGYRDPAPTDQILGRLDAAPWMGGLAGARRGAKGAWTVLCVWGAAVLGLALLAALAVVGLLLLSR